MTEYAEYGFAIYYASYHELDRHKERHPYQFSNIEEDWNEPLTEELIEKYYKKLPDWVIKDLVQTELDSDNFGIHFESTEILDQRLADDIYRLMNSYPTNPLAPEYHQVQTGIMDRKGQHWLDENDVSHTSMSMGDMVMTERTVDSTDGPVTIRKFLYCQSNGWKQFDLV